MSADTSITANVSGGQVGVVAQQVRIENQYVGVPPSSGRATADLGIARIFQTRTRAFTDEYLVSETGPVPFGGRDEELRRLDAWLLNPQSPARMLVTAPAGRGKSALLVRWMNNLQDGGICGTEGWQLAFMPISIRIGTNRPEVFYEGLARRLAEITGVNLPTEAFRDSDGFRYAVRDQLDRLGSDMKPRALIVIDGIDEALDGSFDPGVLPTPLPANVRLLLSARWQLGDHNSRGWLERLGWDRSAKVDAFELDPLDATRIADVLVKLGAPVSVLTQDPDLVERLAQLTEGEPLLVRYYAEDLWSASSKGARITRADLEQLRPGFDSYFKRWFELQEKLWKEEGGGLDRREVDAVLSILAFALGPLGEADLLSIMERVHGLRGVTAVDRLLEPLRRWVFGNGKGDAEYVLSHPRIGEYLQRSRFGASAARLREGFADWSKEHCIALNEGKLAPEQASPYCLQFLPDHLKQVRASPDDFMLIVENGWRSSWEKFEGGHLGFSSAVRTASVALREDTSQLRFGSRWRCALTLSSIRSLGEKVPTELALAAVAKGVLTVRQAAHFAEMKGACEAGVRLLIGLSIFVGDNLRFTAELLSSALAATKSISNERERASVLAVLIPHLSKADRHKALSEALTETGNYDDGSRVHLLEVLTPHLSAEQAGEALALARAIGSEQDRATALVALVRRLPKEVAGEALAALKVVGNADDREKGLSALVPYLSPRQREEALTAARGVGRGEDVSRALSGLASQEVASRPDTTLGAKVIEIEYIRSGALLGLHQHLTQAQRDEILSKILTRVRKEANEHSIVDALQALVPHLNIEQINEAFGIAQTIKNDQGRVAAFVALAPYLNSDQLIEVFAIFNAFSFGPIWLHAITALASYLGREQLTKALAATLDLDDELDRSKALSALAPYLPPKQLREALKAAKMIGDEIPRSKTFSALAPHLEFEQISEALASVKTIGSEPTRSQTLIVLASLLGEEKERQVLCDAVKDAGAIDVQPARSLALAALASHLNPQEKDEVLQDAFALAQKIKGEPTRSLALIGLSPHLPTEQRVVVLRNVLATSKTIANEESRSKILSALASTLTQEQLNEVLTSARAITDQGHRSRALIALAPYLEPQQIGPLFASVHSDGQTQLLAVLVPFIAPEHRHEVFRETLTILETFGGQELSATRLADLPPELLRLALAIAWGGDTTDDLNDLTEARLARLLANLDNDTEVRTLAAVKASDETRKFSSVQLQGRLQLLVALAPYLAPGQLGEALITAKKLRRGYYRSKVLVTLARHLREKARDEALREALLDAKYIVDKSQQAEVLAGLLVLVPSDQKLYTLLALVDTAGESSRWATLSAVQACAVAICELGGEGTILELCRAVKDTSRWFP